MPSKDKTVQIVAPHMRVPWTWLTVGLALIAGSALGTLAVVVTVNGVDTLSTVALALAILAFAAQLIISLAQGIAASQQLAHVERVNADTQSTLAALRAAVDALLANQSQHFTDLLKAFLSRDTPPATASSDDTTGNPSPPENQFLERLLGQERRREPGPEFRALTELPEEKRGRELAAMFMKLTPWAAQHLSKLVRNAVARSSSGMPHGGWLPSYGERGLGPANVELRDSGIVRVEERLQADGTPGHWLELTPLGLEVGSLIGARESSPDWLHDAVRS